MFSSIPADRIVSVVPSAVGTGGEPLSLSTLLICPVTVGQPRIIGVKEFGSAPEVAGFFGLNSDEAAFANRYFMGYEGATKIPSRIWLAGAKDTAQGAVLQSAKVGKLDDVKINGALSFALDGTAETVAVDLTGATSFSNVATLINAELTAGTIDAQVEFIAAAGIFELTTTGTGAAKTLSFATGTLAEVLKFREEDGAQVENGTDVMSIDELMAYCLETTQNFGVITFLEELTAQNKEIAATWATGRKSRFMMVIQDTSGAALVPNNDASFGAWLAGTDQDGTLPYFGGIDKIAALCGGIAAIDFKRFNGRRNIMFMRQAGLAADIQHEDQYTALISNGYTFYAAFATATERFQFQTNGKIAGKFSWADNYINQIYLNAQLQLALMNMLVSYGSIPYNETGKAYHRAAIQDPINEMVNFGGIRPLEDPGALSEQQKAIINSQAGQDVIAELLAKGWVAIIETADAQTRGLRGAMPFTLWYTDGGSVQSVNLASVNVQ